MMDEVAKPYAAALSEVLRTADLFEFTAEEGVRIGTQFTTCFTKVQMLTQKALLAGELLLSDAFPGEKRNKLALVQAGPTQFTCFTGTKVQILTQKALQRVPLGVVVAIPPYNYPLNLAGSKVGPALMAGNAVVMKPPSAGAVTGILGIAAGA
jgi:glyceraldehyde-3-phosphate dehydrogenase (NADP+)